MQFAFIGGLGTPELVVILIVALLLFGSRLPSVMRSLGQSVNQFKQGMNDAVEAPIDPLDDKANKADDENKTAV